MNNGYPLFTAWLWISRRCVKKVYRLIPSKELELLAISLASWAFALYSSSVSLVVIICYCWWLFKVWKFKPPCSLLSACWFSWASSNFITCILFSFCSSKFSLTIALWVSVTTVGSKLKAYYRRTEVLIVVYPSAFF